jgi:YesN/AraC family two-component response regulator
MQFASNGQEALEFLDSSDQPPDVMLVDLRMPGMDGLALLSRLEDRHYSGYIVVTSGVDAETMNSVQEFSLRGNIRVLGFLQKPLKADVLKDLLENRAG